MSPVITETLYVLLSRLWTLVVVVLALVLHLIDLPYRSERDDRDALPRRSERSRAP
ncbi:MAG: hypothetical protein ACJ79S_13335 [Gemmatimonadaceae bacterium]